jgi:hypothetical protein
MPRKIGFEKNFPQGRDSCLLTCRFISLNGPLLTEGHAKFLDIFTPSGMAKEVLFRLCPFGRIKIFLESTNWKRSRNDLKANCYHSTHAVVEKMWERGERWGDGEQFSGLWNFKRHFFRMTIFQIQFFELWFFKWQYSECQFSKLWFF